MKYIFITLTLCSICSGAFAQTIVTLTVDMSGEEVSAEGVDVAGTR